jgi:DNA gyrase subunit A
VADPQGYLLTVCEKGYGKRTPFGANIAGVEPPESEAEEPAEEPAADAAEPGSQGVDLTRERGQMRYRKQKRGGKGLHDIRTGERNGLVVGTLSVRGGDDIMLMTTQGMVNRTHVDEIRVVGRNTLGVRIMNLNEGDKIASIAKIARDETAVQPEAPAGQDTPPAPEANDAVTEE